MGHMMNTWLNRQISWKAVARMKDFLLQKVNSLKKPKPDVPADGSPQFPLAWWPTEKRVKGR